MKRISRDKTEPMLRNPFKYPVLSAPYLPDDVSGLGVQKWTKETEITAFMEFTFFGVEDNKQRVKMYQLWNLLNN